MFQRSRSVARPVILVALAGFALARIATGEPPITTLTLADLDVDASHVGLLGARTQVVEAAARPPRDNRVLVQDTGDAGVRLAAYLVDNQLV